MSLDSIFLNHFAFGTLFPSPAQVVAHQIIISGLWSHSSFIKLLYRVSFFILKPTKKKPFLSQVLTSLLSLLFFFSLTISQCCYQFTLDMQMPYIIISTLHTSSFPFYTILPCHFCLPIFTLCA